MTTRLARASDARAIAVVHVRSWQGAYRDLRPREYLDGLDPGQRVAGWDRTLGEADWPRRGVFVAEQAGEVVGFASFCPARDDDLDRGCIGEVPAIYLVPAAWGQGLGRQLMTDALAAIAAAGFSEAALWVLDANERARAFYQAGGWSADGAVKQDRRVGFTLHEVRYRRPVP
jgi:GNAT superfamily N-acetyltransferase